jgi:hypothetical protein
MTETNPDATAPSQLPRRPGRNTSLIAFVVGGLVLLGIAAPLLRWWINGPPFQMVIEPGDDQATVQFSNPGSGRRSQQFPVEVNCEQRQVVILDSPSVTIPGGRIEFADTTLLPGRFQIRFGEKVFDVMVGTIEVDGQPFEWK